MAGFGVELDQRLLHQAIQQIEHVGRSDGAVRAHRFRRRQHPASREHREPSQQRALGIGQEVVAPVDARAQRLLPRQRRAIALGQQPEAVGQARRHRVHRERARARGRKLERQRNAIEAPADVGERPPRSRRSRETTAARPSRDRRTGAPPPIASTRRRWPARSDREPATAAACISSRPRPPATRGWTPGSSGADPPAAGPSRAPHRRAPGVRSCRGSAAVADARRASATRPRPLVRRPP